MQKPKVARIIVLSKYLQQPNKLFVQSLKKRGVSIHDLLIFLREKNDNGKALYGKVDAHFSAEGQRVVADYLLPVVGNILMQKSPSVSVSQ